METWLCVCACAHSHAATAPAITPAPSASHGFIGNLVFCAAEPLSRPEADAIDSILMRGAERLIIAPAANETRLGRKMAAEDFRCRLADHACGFYQVFGRPHGGNYFIAG